MKQCEGFPQSGCPNEATNHMLGWDLCDDCSRAFATTAPSDANAALRLQLARAHEALNRCILLAETLAAWGNHPDAEGIATEIERAKAALKEIPQ